MPKAVSDDLKARIPILYAEGLLPAEIVERLCVSRHLVFLTLHFQNEHGVPHHPNRARLGWQHILSAECVTLIDKLLVTDHTLYLDEIQAKLLSEKCVKASISTIKHTLDRMCTSCKRVTKEAIERNDLLCAAFVNEVARLVPNSDMLLCVDKSSNDDRTVD
jgi:transposase